MYHDISPAVEKNKGLDYTIKSFLAKFFIKDKGSVTDLNPITPKLVIREKSQRTESIYISQNQN